MNGRAARHTPGPWAWADDYTLCPVDPDPARSAVHTIISPEGAYGFEANEKDIAGGPGLPSSLEMMTMATNFEAAADKRIKSKVRLQSGGVALEYVDTDDEATIGQMRLFERFQIALPVFWRLRDGQQAVPAWPLTARLKYRVAQGEATFWYELVRPDLVHEAAALTLIAEVRAGLGSVPLRMGSCG